MPFLHRDGPLAQYCRPRQASPHPPRRANRDSPPLPVRPAAARPSRRVQSGVALRNLSAMHHRLLDRQPYLAAQLARRVDQAPTAQVWAPVAPGSWGQERLARARELLAHGLVQAVDQQTGELGALYSPPGRQIDPPAGSQRRPAELGYRDPANS